MKQKNFAIIFMSKVNLLDQKKFLIELCIVYLRLGQNFLYKQRPSLVITLENISKNPLDLWAYSFKFRMENLHKKTMIYI